nr:hypothetical protein [Rhizobium hidalgonense]
MMLLAAWLTWLETLSVTPAGLAAGDLAAGGIYSVTACGHRGLAVVFDLGGSQRHVFAGKRGVACGIDLDALEREIPAAAGKLQSAACRHAGIGIDDVLAADRHRLGRQRDAVGGIERRIAARQERAAALDGVAGDGQAASRCDQAGIVEIADIT